MNDRQTQFSSITTTGRTSPVRPNLPVRYSSWGSRTEAEKSAGLQTEFNPALSNHDAAKWLDMMRKNRFRQLSRQRTLLRWKRPGYGGRRRGAG